jgi:hypothetical protein
MTRIWSSRPTGKRTEMQNFELRAILRLKAKKIKENKKT